MSQEIKTELSLPQQLECIISDIQKEIMQEEIEELSPIKENDVNIATIYIYDDREELEAKVYFRNGLNRKINFEDVPLVLIDGNGKVLCSQVFDLREIGDIPACAATPWKLYFNKKDLDLNGISLDECKVIFNSSLKAVNYAKIGYEELPEELMGFKHDLQKFLEKLPKIEKNQLSMSTFNIGLQIGGKLIVTLVIRNSADKDINISEIPLTVKDENNNIVAAGKFIMKDFSVKSMKAKICNLAFETNLTTDKPMSMDKFHVAFA
ncbi:SLAP domain-containing protein [Clostridium sp. WILCCON 0269]|uniref:SLAP domain-containing protein n=1 Tax=Candidatus Clostridium eludens TaxID=3381663 RepID=A0ABW8SGM6_9CLOT